MVELKRLAANFGVLGWDGVRSAVFRVRVRERDLNGKETRVEETHTVLLKYDDVTLSHIPRLAGQVVMRGGECFGDLCVGVVHFCPLCDGIGCWGVCWGFVGGLLGGEDLESGEDETDDEGKEGKNAGECG